jgi:hypothetical protein
VDTDQSVITENGFFQKVVLAVELPDFLGFGVFLDGTIFVVTDGKFTGLYCYSQLCPWTRDIKQNLPIVP